MTLGNPIKESAGSQRPRSAAAERRVEAAGCSPMRDGHARVGVAMPQSVWDDTPIVSSGENGHNVSKHKLGSNSLITHQLLLLLLLL